MNMPLKKHYMHGTNRVELVEPIQHKQCGSLNWFKYRYVGSHNTVWIDYECSGIKAS